MTTIIFMFGNYFAHMNLRVDLGRFTMWINNPQYHRLHHSNRSEHFDHNFTQLLPLWDHLFGTLWVPAKHEWPATGLDDGAQPRSLLGALSWPLRSHADRVLGQPRAAHRFAAQQADDRGSHDEHA